MPKQRHSCSYRFIHRAGTMTYQQPYNNIARCAIQTLAGALAGCTAIDNACLDNAYAEPSAFAARMSLNTQHIVSDETGVTDVTDPLCRFLFCRVSYQQSGGGSIQNTPTYRESGWNDCCRKERLYPQHDGRIGSKKQKEIESGERLIVGVNELVIPPEEDDDIPIQSVEASDSEEIAIRMENWRKTRDMLLLNEKPQGQLFDDTKKDGNYNLMPSIIEAVKAYGTAGEIMGVIRMAQGFPYDPLEMIYCPFDL